MAQCKQNAQEFVQDTFNPHVAVLCSRDAEVLCQKNNLTFVELVQPFCRLASEGNAPSLCLLFHIVASNQIFFFLGEMNCDLLLFERGRTIMRTVLQLDDHDIATYNHISKTYALDTLEATLHMLLICQ